MGHTADDVTTVLDEATADTIQDEDIERDRVASGLWFANRTQEYRATATAETIRNFANSYGDDNPLYCEPDHGRLSRWGGQVAPAIMAGVLNAPLRGDRPARELRGGSYRGIHSFVSGGTWEWYRPVRPGDTLHSYEGVESVEVKASEFAGRSVIRTLRTVKFNQHAEVVGVYRTLVINAERGAARRKGKEQAPDEAAAGWSTDALAEVDALYAEEARGRRGREPRFFDDVVEGEALPRRAKGPLRTTDIIAFHAGGYGFTPFGLWQGKLDWQNRQRIPAFYVPDHRGVPDVAQRVHWDPDWARAIGARGSYDYGVLRECWLHHYVTDWMGDDAIVLRQHDELRAFNYHGDVQFVEGHVVAKRVEQERHLVDLEVTMTNQRGAEALRGEVTVALPTRSGGPPLYPSAPMTEQATAVRMLARHAELVRTGAEPRTVTAADVADRT